MASAAVVAAALVAVLAAGCKEPPQDSELEVPPATAILPPGVIFRAKDGRTITTAELVDATGEVDWATIGTDDVSDAARRLHAEGRAAGSRGDYAAAIALFDQAHAAAPRWPYPPYDAAFTYELMGQPGPALAAYDQVLALAPRGFKTAMASADCLRRELAREWRPGACQRYAKAELEDPAARNAALEAIVAEAPGIAAAWKDLGLAAQDDAVSMTLFDRALAQRPDPGTRGQVRAYKALAVGRAGNRADAIQTLGELALDPRAPLAVVAFARAALAHLAAP